jgi:argonaute-like protein implicated in RNA metabolism and viral defense
MRKYGGHMGKYGQNIMVNIIPRTYGKMKKYEKISKKYISDIWEKMADMWQQNTSRTYGKICHPLCLPTFFKI